MTVRPTDASQGDTTRTGAVWALRVLWFLLPLTLLTTIGDIRGSDAAGATAITVVGWALWVVGLAATALPMPLTLTIVRVLAPATLLVAVWSAVVEPGVRTGVAVLHTVVLVVTSLLALVGDHFVDGASYGDERRMLLRPGASDLTLGVPLAWLIAVAGLGTPLVLAASGFTLAALVAAPLGVLAAAAGVRALHQLARRWIVFVPNGMVLHDLTVLTEPTLFRRTAVERLMPAIEGSPARDFSQGASGLLLECQLADPAPLGLRTPGRAGVADAELTDVRRFLFAPTRPGALLDEAARRRLEVF